VALQRKKKIHSSINCKTFYSPPKNANAATTKFDQSMLFISDTFFTPDVEAYSSMKKYQIVNLYLLFGSA